MQDREDRFEQELFQMAEQEKLILPDTVYDKVNDTLVSLQKRTKPLHMTWKKSVILAAALIALCSITVTAAVGAMQQRMEAMNEKEMEDYFVQIYENQIGADNYNRPFTEAERKRMEDLNTSYEEEALFPSGMLTMLSRPEDYKGRGVGFYGRSATFFFPEDELSDEELLQVIDFRHKRDYSLLALNEQIEAGEKDFPVEEIAKEKEQIIEATDQEVLQSEAVWDPAQELTIPYTGDLSMQLIAAGTDCLFLTGASEIHKMEIGSSDSKLFFDDFDTRTVVTALYQDHKGDIYLGLLERTDEEEYDKITLAGEKYRRSIWILDAEGEVKKKIDLSGSNVPGEGHSHVSRLVADEQGYIYIRTGYASNALLWVLDGDGNFVKEITSETYRSHFLGGLGIGKDGKVYTMIELPDIYNRRMGIASVNLEKGTLEDVYEAIVPDGTIMLDIIAPGADTDFVFWGYDGIFTYNLGEESAVNILPAYEAPCQWEGCLYCALPDGRIVFVSCTEYEKDEEKQTVYRIPDKTCFYYKSGLRNR